MWIVVLGCFSGAVCRRWCHKTERQRAVGSLQRRKYKKVAVTESAGDSKEDDAADADASEEIHLCDPESQYDQDSCVICLSEFENGDNVTTLPCGHDYHTECIKPWLLKRSSKCPICKASFLPKKKKASQSSLESNVATPLLSGQQNASARVDEGPAAADVDEQSDDGDAEDGEFEEDGDEDDERYWPNRVFGLSPGALVLTAACTTGIGIAVAIVIFLLDSSLP